MASEISLPLPQSLPAATDNPLPRPRVWPAVVLLALFWAFVLVSRRLDVSMFAAFLARLGVCLLVTVLFLVWWLTNRRVRGVDRLLGVGAAVVGGIAGWLLLDPSVVGMLWLMMSLPLVLTAWTVWVVAAARAPARVRRFTLVAVLFLSWQAFFPVRMEGLEGDGQGDFFWRWSLTPEQRFLAGKRDAADSRGDVLSVRPGDWPGFRGPERDGVVRGLTIDADWDAQPPRQVWRQLVGPGWSSVVVVDGLLFTQEQRDKSEAVVCLEAATGREVWAHLDDARFYENLAGAGPRATPTFDGGRLYTLGATGILNCFDAATGERKWSRNVTETGANVPLWGFTSSPLVVKGLVVVHAGDKGLLAYRADSGELAWAAPAGTMSYSSPHAATIAGREQILFLSDRGLLSVDPEKGKMLWEHQAAARGAGLPRSTQPRDIGNGQIVIAAEGSLGTELIDVTRDGDVWTHARRWNSRELKPPFNDFVVHAGFIYGFDTNSFCCLDARTGELRWKEGRYGQGQVLLLADQGLLLVITERGEAVLLAADPDRHDERGRFQAVNGKTWNLPAVAGGRLYVRNAKEMACYELRGSDNR
jgi:outer membrane protein assembly factor BamB